MSPFEMFDVFDENMKKIGEASRRQVHKEGLWHQTFHCWVLNRETPGGPSLLLQLRHKDKDTFPNMFDVSCAGHLLAGETIEDGVRELEEELGLLVPFERLTFCGTVSQEYVMPNVIDREFNHIFTYECSLPIEAFHFQRSEISGLCYVNINDVKEILNDENYSVETQIYLFNEEKNKLEAALRTVNQLNITPQSEEYYNLLFNNIK